MNNNVTVSVKALLGGLLVMVAVVAAYVVGQAGDPPAQAAVAAAPRESQGDARTLTMRGLGKVTTVPDQAAFDVTVQVTRPDISTALEDTNALLDGVLDTLDGLGIAEDDVETTGLQMNPAYRYVKRHREFRGYHVEQSVAVLVEEFDDAGAAISAVVESGGNAVRVGDIRLRIGDPESALADARSAAVDEATAKAQEYAEATGQSLGAVMTLVEVDPQDVRSQVSEQSLGSFAATDSLVLSDVALSAGRSDISVTVQIVWELA